MLLLWIVNHDIGIYDTQPRVDTHVVNVSHLISSSGVQFMNFFYFQKLFIYLFFKIYTIRFKLMFYYQATVSNN